jgi:hypothetical protein
MKIAMLIGLLMKFARSPKKGPILLAIVGGFLLIGTLSVAVVGFGGYFLWQQRESVASTALTVGEKAQATVAKAHASSAECLPALQSGLTLAESMDITAVIPALTAAYNGCVRPALQALAGQSAKVEPAETKEAGPASEKPQAKGTKTPDTSLSY